MLPKGAHFLMLFCLLWCALSEARAEKRVALVVGNSAYALAPLTNPRNDADDLAAALRRLDFAVTKELDLTVAQFDRAIERFETDAKDADVALFFFSGHGVQIDKRGYLAPVDIRAESESSAFRELEPIQEIVARIENAAKVSVILLDACRDSPLQERLRRIALEKHKDLIPPKGLPSISVTGSNTLIVYATAPGETASDGAGRNSPFTESLLKYIEMPGLEVEQMFKKVTSDVLRKTGGKQQPERLSRLQSELLLLKSQENVASGKSDSLIEVKKSGSASGVYNVTVPTATPSLVYEDKTSGLVHTFSNKFRTMALSYSPNGRLALAAGGSLNLLDLSSGQVARSFSVQTGEILAASVAPDGNIAASGSCEYFSNPINKCTKGSVDLWELKSGKKVKSFQKYEGAVNSVSFSYDGKILASGGYDCASINVSSQPRFHTPLACNGFVSVWDVQSGQLQFSVRDLPEVYRVYVAPGNQLYVYQGGSFKVWDLKTKTEQKVIKSSFRSVFTYAVSQGINPRVAFGSDDGIFEILDGHSGDRLRDFKGHLGWCSALAFSPQGYFVMSGSSDKTLKLWEIETGRELHTFWGHTELIRAIAFSPDGRFALSSSDDGTIKLWDLAGFIEGAMAARK